MFGVRREAAVPANLGALISDLTSHKVTAAPPAKQPTATRPAPLAAPDAKIKEDLYEQEKAVAAHRMSWVRAGAALREISERALYRWKNDTFEEYLRTRWRFSKRYGYDLITAAGVAENVREVKHLLTVRAAIKLAKLPAEQQAECLSQAIAGCGTRSPTAEYLAAAVAARLGKKPAAKKSKPKKRGPVRIRLAGGTLTIVAKKGIDLLTLLREALALEEARIPNSCE